MDPQESIETSLHRIIIFIECHGVNALLTPQPNNQAHPPTYSWDLPNGYYAQNCLVGIRTDANHIDFSHVISLRVHTEIFHMYLMKKTLREHLMSIVNEDIRWRDPAVKVRFVQHYAEVLARLASHLNEEKELDEQEGMLDLPSQITVATLLIMLVGVFAH